MTRTMTTERHAKLKRRRRSSCHRQWVGSIVTISQKELLSDERLIFLLFIVCLPISLDICGILIRFLNT